MTSENVVADAVPPAHTAELGELLARRGFKRHTMFRNRTGHLQIAGALNGQLLAMLVDTGASTTVVDLPYCQKRGISLREIAAKGGGAGGMSLALHALDEAEIRIGDSSLPSTGIYAIDLSHVNKGLTMKGADPIQMVIGADLLLRHKAVIDYANLSLFLRLPAGSTPSIGER